VYLHLGNPNSINFDQKGELMPLPEVTIKLIKEKLSKYCMSRFWEHASERANLSIQIKGAEVILIKTRPDSQDRIKWTDYPVAKFRFDNEKNQWLLYSFDKNNRWLLYDLIQPSTDFDDLLKELDRDPTGIFWG
jgi:hypothetical protein